MTMLRLILLMFSNGERFLSSYDVWQQMSHAEIRSAHSMLRLQTLTF